MYNLNKSEHYDKIFYKLVNWINYPIQVYIIQGCTLILVGVGGGG